MKFHASERRRPGDRRVGVLADTARMSSSRDVSQFTSRRCRPAANTPVAEAATLRSDLAAVLRIVAFIDSS